MGERKQKKKRNREFDDRHHQQTFSFLLVSRDYWFYYDDHSVRRITITNHNNDDGCHIQNDNVLWTMMTTTHTLTLKPNNNQTITFPQFIQIRSSTTMRRVLVDGPFLFGFLISPPSIHPSTHGFTLKEIIPRVISKAISMIVSTLYNVNILPVLCCCVEQDIIITLRQIQIH